MLHIGAASKVINNKLGRYVQAAGHEQTAKRIRDDLEANALYLTDGSERMLLVSCDLAGLETRHATAARQAAAEASGLPERGILIAGTHTHSGPSVHRTHWRKPVDEEYLARLAGWLAELAAEAVASARPAEIAWGVGSARLGYNRRLCWADGTHTMHGDVKRPGFTGLEGPDDPAHLALFARDAEGKVLAVLHHNTTHPTNFYGADFYSADFPGATRAMLRENLGGIPVLFFNGAQGDVANVDQASPNKNAESREARMMRMAHMTVGETMRLLHEARFVADVPLAHVFEDLPVAVRLPEPRRLEKARAILARAHAGETDGLHAMDIFQSFGTARLHELCGENPVDRLAVHALRLGDLGVATQPCELFCQFGLDIKRRSPAAATAVFGITDGHGGYCPTVYGILGGGYSGEPTSWCRLEVAAGYKIVDCASKLLHQLWR